MAIAKVQTTSGNGTSLVLNGVASANMLTVATSYFRFSGTGAPGTPTDTNGTFAVASADPPLSGDFIIGTAIWDEKNCASGTHTIGGLESTHWSTLTEWSGADTTGPFDVAKSASSNVGAHTSQATGTTNTTSQADEMVYIAFCAGATPGASPMGLTDPVSGFTTLKVIQDDQNDLGVMHAFKTINATGTQSATFNWTDNSASETTFACIATFKAASSGVTAALTGQAETFATGTLTPALSLALTGQAATLAEGTMTPLISPGLTGQLATFAEGTLTPNLSIALTGQDLTFTQGTLTPSGASSVTQALTGQDFTFAQGTLTPSITTNVTATLVGQQMSFSQGLLTPSVQNFGGSHSHRRPWWYKSYDDELERLERERRERVRLGIITVPQSRRIKQSIETAQEDLEEAVLLAMNEQLTESARVMKSVSDRIDKLVTRLHIERKRKEEQEREDDDEEIVLSLLPYM